MDFFTFFTESLSLVIQVKVFVAIFCGLILGMVAGALPGLTTATTMAIFLPVSFLLEPLIAIPFLLGIYKGGIYGGSIPAILIATPGTGASIATTFDGPELVRQGKARKALDMALYSSVSGDFLSDCVTLLLVAPIAVLTLAIGPPELAPIFLCALLIVVVVSRGGRPKALALGLLGLALASIGRDPVEYSERLTFGVHWLADGIPMLPMLVGLFAVPEISRLILSASRKVVTPVRLAARGSSLTFKELIAVRKTILRSTVLGTSLGIVPGIGQPVAALTGYALAKRKSAQPELFGKGSLEGIAAAETANNAVNGPTLIPLLTLGIPGDKITAILMGAFVAHGMRPGPGLVETQGSLILAILLSMLIANILLLVVARPLIPTVARLVELPASILAPIVLTMAFLGAYLYRNSPDDLYFVVIFGMIGMLTKQFNTDVTPLVLGFIISEPLEYALAQTAALSGGDVLVYILFERPIALVLYLLLAGSLLWLLVRTKRGKSNAKPG